METRPLSFRSAGRGELPLADKNECLGFGQNLLRFNLLVSVRGSTWLYFSEIFFVQGFDV